MKKHDSKPIASVEKISLVKLYLQADRTRRLLLLGLCATFLSICPAYSGASQGSGETGASADQGDGSASECISEVPSQSPDDGASLVVSAPLDVVQQREKESPVMLLETVGPPPLVESSYKRPGETQPVSFPPPPMLGNLDEQDMTAIPSMPGAAENLLARMAVAANEIDRHPSRRTVSTF